VSLPVRMDLLKDDVLRGHPRKTCGREDCEVYCIYTQIILSLSVIFLQQCRYHMEAAMLSSASIS